MFQPDRSDSPTRARLVFAFCNAEILAAVDDTNNRGDDDAIVECESSS